MHLIGFIVRIYRDARSSECQNSLHEASLHRLGWTNKTITSTFIHTTVTVPHDTQTQCFTVIGDQAIIHLACFFPGQAKDLSAPLYT